MNSRWTRWVWVALFAALGACGAGFAGDGVRVAVVSDDGNRIVLNFEVLDFETEPVFIEGQPYIQLRVPGEPLLAERGAPALPHVNRSIVIPNDGVMEVRLLSSDAEDFVAMVAPSKGPLSRSVDPATVPYEFGDVYFTDALFPAAVAELGPPYILRDRRGAVIQINPFQFNAATGLVRFHRKVTVEVVRVAAGGENTLSPGAVARPEVRSFKELQRSHFLNYRETTRLVPFDEEGELLIIAHDPWIANFDAFVAHKQGRGVTTRIVGVSTIGNDAASIKNYIQGVYDSRNLAFVLLAGDAAQVATPIRAVGAEQGASDPTYSKLAGADNYPDIIVGRFSAQTTADLDTQIQRTIEYESLPATSQAWYHRGVGIGSDQGAGAGDDGQSDKQHIDQIRGWLLNAGYTLVDQVYDPGASDTMVANALNAGRGVVNYCGHGSATSWGTTGFNSADVHALQNDNMLPFVVSVACNNGEFNHYDECFAEAWLRSQRNGEPIGAIGMYASSVSQSWAPPMEGQDEFNLKLTDPTAPFRSYGALCYAGSCSMMDKYGSGGVEMFDTWNIFGDPSLRVLGPPGLETTPLDGLSASGDAGGPFAPASKVFTLKNNKSVPLQFEVSSPAPWVFIAGATGTIPPGGQTTVTVTLNDHARNLDHGDHADFVQIRNMTDHDGDTSRPLLLGVGLPKTIERWMFDASPGWSVQGEWGYGVPQGLGGGHGYLPDPTAGATGASVYGVNLGGNFAKQAGGPFYLTAGPFNLNGADRVQLSFQRWLNTPAPPEITTQVQVSVDGGGWTTVWSATDAVLDAVWSPQALDISAYADHHGSVSVRWGYGVVSRVSYTASGWNIDDVALRGRIGSARIGLTVDSDRLSWGSIAGAAGYDVVRGDVAALRASGGDFGVGTQACLGHAIAATQLNFAAAPPAGAAWWFLVRAEADSGPLTYNDLAGVQTGARDDEINTSPNSCQ